MLLTIEINGQQVSAKRGETILTVLNRIGVKVPTLCSMPSFSPTGACRMCVVEVEGLPRLVPACSHQVEEWMQIRTHSTRVLQARKTLVELLLANHPDDCLYCERNNNCELQKLAEELQVRERKYLRRSKPVQIDKACPSIQRDPAKCLLCGRCSRVCQEVIGVGAIEAVGKGSETQTGTSYNRGLNFNTCVRCGQCIMVCPTAALTEKKALPRVMEALSDTDLYPVAMFSPTVPAALAEEYGLKSNKDILNLLRAALRRMGFRQSFDASLGADITLMEEASIFLERWPRGKNLPLITSCCPSWVRFAENSRPDILPNLSPVKSPQQLMGTLIKQYITSSAGIRPEKVFTVSIMPCTAKKSEAEESREEDSSVNAVITIRELFRMINLLGVDFSNLEPEPTDTAFSMSSSSGRLFGIAGGHLEGLIRSIHFLSTGNDMNPPRINDLRGLKQRKDARIRLNKQALNVVAVSGLANAISLVDEVRNGREDIHIIEVMACPNGCINGGGHKIGSDEKSLKGRMKALYDIDEEEMVKMAHKNPVLNDIYEKFVSRPNSGRNQELFHRNSAKTEQP